MTIPECPQVDPEFPVFFPHPTDPNKYYECSNGTPILQSCPPGLVWDQEDMTCVRPSAEWEGGRPPSSVL